MHEAQAGRGDFAPVGSYGVIGDGRSVALVAADGAIDWCAAPAMDAPPVFAAILDPESGGSFTLEPAVPYRTERRYLPGTNVLETTFSTDGGLVRVVDAFNRDVSGLLGWTELACDIRAERGEVPMRWRVAPGTGFHRRRPWAWEGGGTPLLGATEAAWRRWCQTVSYHGPDRDLVLRSALVLKLLTYAPTGALMAAAATSLPERVGGQRNFDYRYGWIRDTSFALEALIRLGLQHQAHGMLCWMLSAIAGTAPAIRPCYGLRGQGPEGKPNCGSVVTATPGQHTTATRPPGKLSGGTTATCWSAPGWRSVPARPSWTRAPRGCWS